MVDMTVTVSVGEPVTAEWCPHCLLPSAVMEGRVKLGLASVSRRIARGWLGFA
jgi:hypothetical protein